MPRLLSDLLGMIKFSHTLFALPFALFGACLAARGPDGWTGRPRDWLGILLCMAAARSSAMAFNRLVDRRFDARNPRTAGRPSATGEASPTFMVVVVVVASAAFAAASFALNPLCGRLSFVALAVVLGYSYTKRFTAAAHFVLGAGLGLAPVGAWLAVRGAFDAESLAVVAMGAAVLFWTAGFDVLYACQDAAFDRAAGLRSIPARYGVPRALFVARACHALVPPALLLAALPAGLGAAYLTGVAVAALLLVYEHRLVRADDLSRVDVAFFRVNVAVAVTVLVSVLVEIGLRRTA